MEEGKVPFARAEPIVIGSKAVGNFSFSALAVAF
jgi:hypothetical protein